VLLVGCSDSRLVPARLVSINPGEVFEVRSVGNFVTPSGARGVSSGDVGEAAAIEFAVGVLGVRRPGGARAGGYPGAAAIEGQLSSGATIKRVGLVGLERIPVREGATIFDAKGHKLGHVTSGTLGPTVFEPVAMAYLAANHAIAHHEVYAEVRGKRLPMRVSPMPFTPHRYHR
jgi:glycine cleavage system aminomethyltransferase T